MERYGSRKPPRRSHTRPKRKQSALLLDGYGPRTRRVLEGSSARSRRRRSAASGTVAVIALLVLAAAGLWWALTRPIAFAVTAQPADARVTVIGCPDGASAPKACTGLLKASSVKPGTYRIAVARTGFATETVSVDARRFRNANEVVALKPLPERLSISAKPLGAAIRVLDASGNQLGAALDDLKVTTPTKRVRVEVSAPNKNTFTRDLLLDRSTTMTVSLDPKGQLVQGLGLIATSGAPKAVAMTPDGSEAWATILNGPPSIQIFNPRTGVHVGDVNMGKYGAVEVIFNRAGTLAYASQMETAKVFEVDVKTRKVLRGFKTESAWTKVVALSPDEKTLYAANWSGNDVSIIDIRSGELVKRVPVAKTPRGLWPTADGKWLYVGSFGIGRLEKIDLTTDNVKTVFKGGGAMRHLAADEKRGLLYTSDMAKDCVWVTNMKTGKTKLFAHVGHKPNTIALSPDGKVLFVSNRGANNPISYYLIGHEWGSILLLDTTTGKPLDGIVGGNQCTALGVSEDGTLLVFSDFLDNRLRVYQVPSYAVLAAGHGGRSATLAHDVVK